MLLLTPIMILFYQENGLTIKEFFLFQSIFYLVSILAEVPVGYLADRISKKLLLLGSYSIFFFVTIIWLNFKGYFIILLGEILIGISKVMSDNAQSGYLYDYLKYKNEQETMPKKYGYMNFFLSMGTVFAAIIGTKFYISYGTHTILLTEALLMFTSICLIFSLPSAYNPAKRIKKISSRLINYSRVFISICKREALLSYILYSGFLVSFSIVFATSFQPIMLKAMVPVAVFGVAAFFNHGLRALFSLLAGKLSSLFSIQSMIVPLYFLYILAFICIFITLHTVQTKIIISLILLICIIIGIQLLFTIRHISRLHRYVSSKNRGVIISINNFVSRGLAFIALFSAKILIEKWGLEHYYLVLFMIFIFVGLFLMIKANRVKDAA